MPGAGGMSAGWTNEAAIRRWGESVIEGPHAPDFHRPLSPYLNEVVRLGCRVRAVAEPRLDRRDLVQGAGAEAYVRLPDFLVVAAERG